MALIEDLNHFINYFPLVLRLFFLVVFGLYSFTLILHLLVINRVDVFSLLHTPLPVNRSQQANAPLWQLSFSLSILGTLLFVIAESLYLISGSDELAYVPVFIFGVIVFMPVHKFWFFQRKVFTRQCLRILGGSYRPDYKFPDVIFSDLLTSYSRVIADLWLAGAILIYVTDSPNNSHRKQYENEVIMSMIAAYPYAIRFRQCLIERSSADNSSDKFWSTLNSIKYFTAFPAIFLGIFAKKRFSFLWFLWNTSSAINSTYSFWWDVSMDWSLPFFKQPLSIQNWKFGVRRLFPTFTFAVVSAIDFVLRMAWVVRVLPEHQSAFFSTDFGIFIMQFLEVFRRCVWVFFRIEAEASKSLAYVNISDRSDIPTIHPD